MARRRRGRNRAAPAAAPRSKRGSICRTVRYPRTGRPFPFFASHLWARFGRALGQLPREAPDAERGSNPSVEVYGGGSNGSENPLAIHFQIAHEAEGDR